MLARIEPPAGKLVPRYGHDSGAIYSDARGRSAEVPELPSFQLLDGRRARIRSIEFQDADALNAFANRLSPRSLQMRFLGMVAPPVYHFFEHVLTGDFREEGAFVANVAGETEIRGLAEFARHSGDCAEIALVVEDAFQGLGLGSRLLQQLISHCQRLELTTLTGFLLAENWEMCSLFRHCGYPLRLRWEASVARADLSIGRPCVT